MEDKIKELEERLATSEKNLNDVIVQCNQILRMSIDSTIRNTILEEVMFERSIITPNDYKTKTDRVSEEFLKNFEAQIKALKEDV